MKRLQTLLGDNPLTSALRRGEIASDRDPQFRCLAMYSIVESEGRLSVPLLISKLDDKGVCQTRTLTDPPKQIGVFVSDEAVRLLEDAAGQHFEKNIGEHRATDPWKKWWANEGKFGK